MRELFFVGRVGSCRLKCWRADDSDGLKEARGMTGFEVNGSGCGLAVNHVNQVGE